MLLIFVRCVETCIKERDHIDTCVVLPLSQVYRDVYQTANPILCSWGFSSLCLKAATAFIRTVIKSDMDVICQKCPLCNDWGYRSEILCKCEGEVCHYRTDWHEALYTICFLITAPKK